MKVKKKKIWLYTNLVVVQRILCRCVRRWIRRRKLPDELICRIGGGIDVILFNSCAISQIRRCCSHWCLRATTFARIRRSDDRRNRRCCRLNYGCFRMYCIRMILSFPQLTTDKPNCNHSPIASNHFFFSFRYSFKSFVLIREQIFKLFYVTTLEWIENFYWFPKENT